MTKGDEPALVLDCVGSKCPHPIIELARQIEEVPVGALIEILADDQAAAPDIAAWCRMRGHTLVHSLPNRFQVRRDH